MNYIITRNPDFFRKIGDYNYCGLEDMVLPKTIAVDTETTGLKPTLGGHVFAVQIGTGDNNYLIDLQKLGGEFNLEEIVPYLNNRHLVFHNATFDLGWLYHADFWPTHTWDTMIGSMILYNGSEFELDPEESTEDADLLTQGQRGKRKTIRRRHSFGAVMQRELGIKYDKTQQKNIATVQLSNKHAIEYAFNDVDRLLDLFKKIWVKLDRGGFMPAFKTHCQYVRALAYMEQCGLPIDKDLWLDKIQQDKAVRKEKEQMVVDYIYDNLPEFREKQLGLGFFDQVKRVRPRLTSGPDMFPVFEALGINIDDPQEAGKKTLDKNLLKQGNHEFIKLWLDYREADHDVSTYGVNILPKIVKGRIHTSFVPILDTARISTRSSKQKKGGGVNLNMNILNLPANARTRECFRAKEGFQMIVADYEGQENCVGADLHQDPMMLASINEGKDLHCAFVRLAFPEYEKLSDSEIKGKHGDVRQYCKAPRFAKAYGGSGYTIAKNMGVDEEEGERLSKIFDELHPGIKEWGDTELKKALKRGYIESADGFKLHLPMYDDFEREHLWIESRPKHYWKVYRAGKSLVKEIEECQKQGLPSPDVTDPEDIGALRTYENDKKRVSNYFRKRGKYQRLVLNNPVQARSAFQTKRAAILLFDYIVENGHQWRARISNIPHDEFVLEVADELVEEYKSVLEKCMIDAGNYYLTSGLVKMGAEANAGVSWYQAKLSPKELEKYLEKLAQSQTNH